MAGRRRLAHDGTQIPPSGRRAKKNRLCEMFGIEVPIFAFSHCRDVVVEVSRAGGFGVLGMARMSPTRLREELRWIDDHIDGRPYGIDVLMPTTYSDAGELKFDPERLFPPAHLAFVRGLLDDAGIPPLPAAERDAIVHALLSELSFTPAESMAMVEIAMQHPIRLIVNALGSPPRELVDAAHARGIKVAALAGKPKHALAHKARGCDFVIAVGTEAGGHTGSITSMVLWPSVVDAVAPLPVLGAGGVGRGRQVAAALALGCEGVWCGSVWLPSAQSEVTPEIKAPARSRGGRRRADALRDRQALPHAALGIHRGVCPARCTRPAARAAAEPAVVGGRAHARRARPRTRLPDLSSRPDRR